jgi:hypothetical protein
MDYNEVRQKLVDEDIAGLALQRLNSLVALDLVPDEVIFAVTREDNRIRIYIAYPDVVNLNGPQYEYFVASDEGSKNIDELPLNKEQHQVLEEILKDTAS